MIRRSSFFALKAQIAQAALSLALVFGLLSPALRASATELPAAARDLLAASMKISDSTWDDRSALVWMVPSKQHPTPAKLAVRGAAWYAFGLLARDAAGDRQRAVRAIETVLSEQIQAPGEPWDGTFYRSPDEPNPPLFARMWDDYDPNWRQFIGTTWALMLIEFSDRLPPALVPRLEDSIRRAIEGERAQGRLKAEYSNIALMHAFLTAFAGERFHRPEWTREGEELAEKVTALFRKNEAFDEYNSPTYYGVDLYGLALWRAHGPTEKIKKLGSEMEAALWRDVARFYHPGLRNLCGPFDRAYGMDMTQYVSLVGVWMCLALDTEHAPLPDLVRDMEHGHDFGFAPLLAILGVQIPRDALDQLKRFSGEHSIHRSITTQRTATAWLGDSLMLGGEATSHSRAAGTPYSQFHPATIHWRTPSGAIGWVLLKQCSRVDATASANRLEISAIGTAVFRVSAGDVDVAKLTRDGWTLPGLNVRVETDASGFSVKRGEFWTDVVYENATRFTLHTEKSP